MPRSKFLSDEFNAFADKYPKAMADVYCGVECGKGWMPLVEPVLAECEVTGTEVRQIKEKFGRLRIYVAQAPESVYDAIRIAESASANVCETCGRSGKTTTDERWILTLCPPCMAASGRK
jgi:hypothetical protein